MEEQKRAQQEQAELLGQRLAERLRESSARRLQYLEQIKERAAVDPERLRLGADSPYGRLSPSRVSPSRSSPMRRPSSRDGFRSGPRASGTERNAGTERSGGTEGGKRTSEGVGDAAKGGDSTAVEREKVVDASEGASLEVPATQEKPVKPLEKPTIVIPGDRTPPPASGTAVDTSAAKEAQKKRVKRIRQRLVQKKHEWVEADTGGEKVSGSAQGKSRAAKWLLDMQRQQAKGGNGVALESAAGELVKVSRTRSSVFPSILFETVQWLDSNWTWIEEQGWSSTKSGYCSLGGVFSSHAVQNSALISICGMF